MTALVRAATDSDAQDKVVQELLLVPDKRVINMQAKQNKRTALMLAAAEGHEKIVVLLLNAGALVDLQDEYGDTALLRAARNGHKVVEGLLLAARANSELENNAGETVWGLGGVKQCVGSAENNYRCDYGRSGHE